MRYVVFGAGAIGGSLGGKLAAAGKEVALIARGAHLEALRGGGLELADPAGSERYELPAFSSPAEAGLGEGDLVVLAVKSQQTREALESLALALGPLVDQVPVVCAQNGVANEMMALRLFPEVYGMRVVVVASHLEPGLVELATSPVFGLLDVGRAPRGSDATAERVAADLTEAGFDARASEEVMSLKYLKLLGNLANALEAACGPGLGEGPVQRLLERARAEALEVYRAAGIVPADEEADKERRRRLGPLRPPGGGPRGGGSSWQSLARRTGEIETDYLNGEIVLLGRVHSIATPVNSLLQQVARELAAGRRPPGSLSPAELSARL
jgi:2-dehydropantoate 2-reductase